MVEVSLKLSRSRYNDERGKPEMSCQKRKENSQRTTTTFSRKK